MNNWHRLLRRQLQRYAGDLPADTPLNPLLEAISKSYQQADEDRRLLERTMTLTSEELVERNSQLTDQLALLDTSLAASRNGIVMLDPGGGVELCNRQFKEFWQLSEEQLDGSRFDRTIATIAKLCDNGHLLLEQYEHTCVDAKFTTQCTLELHDGRFVECDSRPRERDGKPVGRIWNFHDITDLKIQQQQALHYSMHDYLTDLPNRFLFADRLAVALKRNRRSGEQAALLFLDLDGFKHVNDTMGHEHGDKLLVEVAGRLRRVIRDNDTLARHGGDEFLILLDGISGKQAVEDISDRLLKAVSTPVIINGTPLYVTTSIGAAMAPADAFTTEELIRFADLAMYEAKRLGRNNLKFFRKGMALRATDHLTFKNRLREALANEEFFLLFQPKVDLVNGRVAGAEALVRWRQPDGEILSPDKFIPAAENTGLIIPLSEWIIRQCVAQLHWWQEAGLQEFSMSINISPVHFQQGDLIGTIKSALDQYAIDPAAIELEVTESAVISNMQEGVEKLRELRSLGLRVSIDDFGTGYSSFSYLKNLPIDTIKIDRSFISEVSLSEKDAALVNAIVSVAHTLGMQVVAEGVETGAVVDVISKQGCDFAQGYLFAKPIEAEACFDFSQRFQRSGQLADLRG